ncbi:histidine kinase [Salinibacter grassmerensis]|uniref:histidine kinase n=1 Tax=Salinibacter grassmerensis TaxID=3040353 RepID=UPI0021E72FA6|nr:sensor histidine kinase [Salinibacter grassmerensis]
MPRLSLLVLIAACGLVSCAGPASAWGQSTDPQAFWEGKVRFGDDPRWSDPAYDDSDWPTRRLHPAPDMQGVHWVRVPVTLDSLQAGPGAMGVKLSVLAATEVYWDGVRLGRNGRVGASRGQEEPGRINRVFHVPDSLLAPDEHLIAVRLSNHYMPPDYAYYLYTFEVGDYAALLDDRDAWSLLPLLFLGGFFLVTVYCAALYVLDHRRVALGLFSLLYLCITLLLGAESSRYVVGYTYDWHPLRMQAITALTGAVAGLLPLSFLYQFDVPWKRPVMAGLGGLLALSILLPDAADFRHYWMFWSALSVSLGVVGWAVYHRRPGAMLALVGVGTGIAGLVASGWWFIDTYFVPAFAVIVGALLGTLALRSQEQERRRRQAELTAVRLENELLKKHLQPHFLMNTLTAAMEWLEAEPEVGVRFVEALAEELRLLASISDQDTIPLRREIELCRLHLEVMGYRQDHTYRLCANGIDPEATVPPALLHTLLENALTHNRYDDLTVTFNLRGEALDGGRRYVLHAPRGANSDLSSAETEEGTGLRYVEARLREQYGDDWTLQSVPTSGEDGLAWTTTIEIYDRP